MMLFYQHWFFSVGPSHGISYNLTVIFKPSMESDSAKHGLKTESDQEFAKFACKVVASAESSAGNYSVESKVEKEFIFGQARPFDDQLQTNKCNKNLEKLQEELNNIDKLKLEYESRNDGRMRTFNTQNSEKSRSLEKRHLLKPSQTPFLTRRFDTRIKQANEQLTQSQKRLSNFTKQVEPISPKNKLKLEEDGESQIQLHALREQVARLQTQVRDKEGIIDNLNSTMMELRKGKEELEQGSQSLKEENRVLKFNLQKVKVEKEQLQTILKELLYEREKEKLLHPRQKENHLKNANVVNFNVASSRESFTSGKYVQNRPSPRGLNPNTSHIVQKEIPNNKGVQPQKAIHRVPLEQISNEQKPKKMNVQGILDKLKIKISKN